MPLNIGIRVAGDQGRVASSFDDPNSKPYLEAPPYNLVKTLARRRRQEPAMPSLTVLG